MKKNTIVATIFAVLMAVSAFLFFYFFKVKSTTFWLSFITTELSLLMMGAAAAYNSRDNAKSAADSSLLTVAGVYLVAAAAVNLLFGRFLKMHINLYLAIQIILFVVFAGIFLFSVSFKPKKSRKHRRIERDMNSYQSLLAEIQRLESTVSKVHPDILINVESMLLSLDKEIRYADLSDSEEMAAFNEALRMKIFALAPVLNNMINSQSADYSVLDGAITEIRKMLADPASFIPPPVENTEPAQSEDDAVEDDTDDTNKKNAETPEDTANETDLDLEILDLESLMAADIPEAGSSTSSNTSAESDNEDTEPQTIVVQGEDGDDTEAKEDDGNQAEVGSEATAENIEDQIDTPVNGDKSLNIEGFSESDLGDGLMIDGEELLESKIETDTEPESSDTNIESDGTKRTPMSEIEDNPVITSFKEKISEIEELAKSISFMEELERRNPNVLKQEEIGLDSGVDSEPGKKSIAEKNDSDAEKKAGETLPDNVTPLKTKQENASAEEGKPAGNRPRRRRPRKKKPAAQNAAGNNGDRPATDVKKESPDTSNSEKKIDPEN